MKRSAFTAALLATTLGAPALLAQHQKPAPQWQPPAAGDPAPEDQTDGVDLIGRGMGLLMENLLRDVGPDLERLGNDMSGALDRMAPVLKDLSVLVDDLGNYQAPQRLENGDIVIRRKPGAPPPPPLGDSLRDLTTPEAQPSPELPADPVSPEIEL